MRRVIALVRPGALDRDLDQEIAAHLAEAEEEYILRGLSPAQARLAAIRDFGGVTQTKEQHRDVRSFAWVEDAWRDLLYTARLLWRNPSFTAVIICLLALGIGANTALFSVMDAMMLRMLPVPRADEIVRFRTPLSYPAFRTISERTETVAGMSVFSVFPASVRIDQDAEQAVAQMVSGNFYAMLDVNAAVGRLLASEDDRIPGVGGPDGAVAVISHRYWERRFASDSSIVGRTITLNGVPVTIVGVAAPKFFGVTQTVSPDLTLPIALQPRLYPSTSTELWVHGDGGSILTYDLTDEYGPPIVARLQRGVTLDQAQAELSVLYRQILAARGRASDEQQRRESINEKVELIPAGNGAGLFEPQTRRLFLIVMSAVPAVVLLIACANVATLLLARAAARQRELAVRLSMGSSRIRLIRQLLTESLVLAVAGGAVGILVAAWGRRVLLDWISSREGGFFALQAETDVRTLIFTFGACVAATLLFGTVPAIRATKANLVSTLKTGGRGVTSGRAWEAGRLLVAAQVALSLMLIVGAGLLVRTVRNLQAFDVGFDRDGLYLLHTMFLGHKGPETGALIRELWERTSSVPGVRAVGMAQTVPPDDRRLNVIVDGNVDLPQDQMYVDRLMVGPGFFEAMGIPILAGRAITIQDDEHAPNVCVVSATMARTFFGARSPIGRRFTFKRTGAEYTVEIVGVAKDLKRPDSRGEWRPVYCPMLQDLPTLNAIVLVRADEDASAVLTEMRRQFSEVDKNLFVNVTSMDRRIENNFFFQQLLATIASVFGLLALVIASIGLYGVMAYSVARRSNEVGVRMALGADRRSVVIDVIRQTMAITASGVIVGMAAAWGATQLIASTLFGVGPMDPPTLVFAAGTLVTISLLAGCIPAWRAATVNPVVALRQD
ncbi:MAG: ADOP family duplicated permease [Vicinamibacterales bacterium]